MRIIDAHNHPDWLGYGFDRFIANMDECGIEKTWLFTWECPHDEYDPSYRKIMPDIGPRGPIELSKCLRYKERAPERFVLGYAPDPRRPDAIDQLEAAITSYGVRIYAELKLRLMYDDLDALRLYRYCGEKGLPVTVHIDYEFPAKVPYPRPNYWYGGGIGPFERAVRACPHTIFIGHAPGFWAHISNDGQHDQVPYPTGKVVPGGKVVQMFRECANLYADLSAGSGRGALARDPEFARAFLIEFQDRLLYGRDNFDNELQKLLNSLDLPQEVLQKIYASNALKLIPDDH